MNGLDGHDLLALETRRRIYAYISAYPGTHMRELQRRLGMSSGTLEYHLRVLVREKVLAQRRQGRYMRFYVASQVGRREKDILNLLRQEVPRRACAELLLREGQSHRELLTHFHLAPSTLSFHLKKLVDAGIVDAQRMGRETHYRVRDPALVSRCLVQYKSSFVDDVVDRFADEWAARGGTLVEAEGMLPPEGDTTAAGASPPPADAVPPGEGAPAPGLPGRGARPGAGLASPGEESDPQEVSLRRTRMRAFGPSRSPAFGAAGQRAPEPPSQEAVDQGADEAPRTEGLRDPPQPTTGSAPRRRPPEGWTVSEEHTR